MHFLCTLLSARLQRGKNRGGNVCRRAADIAVAAELAHHGCGEGGVLGAEIEPKNRVLPLLRRHFCNRYANESFFIYDRTHREMLLYTKGRSRLACVDSLQLELPGEEEVYYRTLWKRFFETVAIRERENPRCQNTFMPKRYRGTMTEFLPDDYEARQQCVNLPAASEASPVPGAPAGISAPATRPRSGPSAPGSAP